MNKKAFIYLIVFQLCCVIQSKAQYDLTSSFMPEILASSFSNPAWVPEEKFHIGLPTYFFSTRGTSVDPRNYVDFSGSNPVFNLTQFANQLDEDFQSEVQYVFHPFYFSIKLKDFRIGLEYSARNNSTVSLPADLFNFAAFGNEPYIGQTLNLGPKVSSNTFQQLAIPLALEKGKWTFGVRPSILKGVYSVSTLNLERKF